MFSFIIFALAAAIVSNDGCQQFARICGERIRNLFSARQNANQEGVLEDDRVVAGEDDENNPLLRRNDM